MLKQALPKGLIGRNSNGLKTGFKACMYKLAELSSGTLTDTFGNGPNFTGQGSLTTTATGGLNPASVNSTKYATAAADAYLFDLLSLTGSFGEIILAFDWKSTVTDVVSTNTVFMAGRFNATYAGGGLAVKVATSEKIQVEARGAGAGGSTQNSLSSGSNPLQTTNNCTIVVSMRLNSASEAAVDFLIREGTTTHASSGTLALDSAAAFTAYGTGSDDGYSICAAKTSASGYANYLNGGAAENANIRNLLLLKTPTYDSSLASSILLDMSNNPGEIPRRILKGGL